jgi:protein phosphatase
MKNLSHALEIVGLTDPGMVRGHNEDAIAFDPEIGLAVLADGMGGYNAGEVASGIATTLLSQGVKAAVDAAASARTHEWQAVGASDFALGNRKG